MSGSVANTGELAAFGAADRVTLGHEELDALQVIGWHVARNGFGINVNRVAFPVAFRVKLCAGQFVNAAIMPSECPELAYNVVRINPEVWRETFEGLDCF
jgi:hypothetical protein